MQSQFEKNIYIPRSGIVRNLLLTCKLRKNHNLGNKSKNIFKKLFESPRKSNWSSVQQGAKPSRDIQNHISHSGRKTSE